MCTLEKRCQLFLLKLAGDGEHRLNPTLLDSITSAITQIRSDPSSSQSVLITTSDGKFFSNGYDLALADSDPSLRVVMDSKLRSLVADLISLPMPTIAAVTGHASAAGFVLAMSHDYVLMRRDRGFLYMSELDIELVIPPWFVAMIRMKIDSPAARRDVMLTAEKVTAERGLEMGIVDSSYGSAAETVEGAVRLGEELVRRGVDGHVYGGMREVLLKQHLNKEQKGNTKNLRVDNYDLDVEDKMSLLEWLANEYRRFGCALEFVTNKSQEGSQFCTGFGGIGRILRYQLDMTAFDEGLNVYDDESD
ncbi:hypothetical protein DY000_02011099 [Brassica cretica]|uniref:eRF1 domain-containing protein n=1 Tax=Brassica cretica TaxID=69181 RepID=A0ABQ7CQD5_BRACR|nr:hypothetical protein DY000_02011099 [Brassica cretica]